MEGFVPTVRISQLGRDQLVKMKRTTGLKQWKRAVSMGVMRLASR